MRIRLLYLGNISFLLETSGIVLIQSRVFCIDFSLSALNMCGLKAKAGVRVLKESLLVCSYSRSTALFTCFFWGVVNRGNRIHRRLQEAPSVELMNWVQLPRFTARWMAATRTNENLHRCLHLFFSSSNRALHPTQPRPFREQKQRKTEKCCSWGIGCFDGEKLACFRCKTEMICRGLWALANKLC